MINNKLKIAKSKKIKNKLLNYNKIALRYVIRENNKNIIIIDKEFNL
jgi:hypothetical protein